MTHRRSIILAAVLTLGFATGLCQDQAVAATPASDSVLHDGTPVHLSLVRTVSSESDQPGEVVEFLVKHPLVAGGQVVLPEGASVFGKVIAAHLDDRSGKGGTLEFRLESIKLSNGQEIPLRTIRQLPTNANAEIKPETLTNLVNSPYAPFGHFNNGSSITVPKLSALVLYVAADVSFGNQVVASAPALANEPSDSVATHIVQSNTGAKSLGEIAREQRERGKISGGMVTPQ
jgi:hypothetical protein